MSRFRRARGRSGGTLSRLALAGNPHFADAPGCAVGLGHGGVHPQWVYFYPGGITAPGRAQASGPALTGTSDSICGSTAIGADSGTSGLGVCGDVPAAVSEPRAEPAFSACAVAQCGAGIVGRNARGGFAGGRARPAVCYGGRRALSRTGTDRVFDVQYYPGDAG